MGKLGADEAAPASRERSGITKLGNVFLVLAVAGALLGCESGRVIPMPKELQGFWRTSTEPYADRYLALTPLEVRFGTSETTSTTHEIAEVREIDAEAHERAYRITYLSTEGNEYWLSVRYKPGDRTLRLINQPQLVWKREASFDG